MTKETLTWAVNQLTLRKRIVMASVVQTSGSVPGKVGARLAIRKTPVVFTAQLEERV